MKNLALILLFLTISLSFSDEPSQVEETLFCSDGYGEDATFETCQTLTPDEGTKYCCLFSYEVDGEKESICIPMTQEEYEDRNGYITSLIEDGDDPELKNLKAKIYCAGDKDLPKDVGDDGEDPDDGSMYCSDVDEEDATFEICQTLTPDEGDKYCCFISYEVNGNKGRNCISMKQEEYEDRNGYITSLKENDEQLKNLKAKIYCAGDKELPEDVGDDGENGGGDNGDGEDPDDGSITCEEYPKSYDDELGDCKKLTPAKGNYCCLLSYDNGKDKGDACISLTKDEYEDRNKAITKLQLIEGYSNAKGKILCDGDKTEDSGSTALKITKDILALLLVFL